MAMCYAGTYASFLGSKQIKTRKTRGMAMNHIPIVFRVQPL